jgi:hypothetical protein
MPKGKSKTTERAQKSIQQCRERIDNYNNTVFAIIGFLNTYKHELRVSGEVVIIFQGRKLLLKKEWEHFVTPDLGLVVGEKAGVIGEVKCSFGKDQKNWEDAFRQLKKYEEVNKGWPTPDGTVKGFDIVLLVEHSRSRAIKDYYENTLPSELKLLNPLVIIEFNRSSQQKEFFFFRIEHGKLSNSVVHKKFYEGLNIPMEIFVRQYSTTKIYDVEPEMPVMLDLIFQCVVDKQIRENKFKKLTRKQIHLVEITLQEITDLLRDVYSFKRLHTARYNDGQPEFPKAEWVRNAFDKLNELGEGTWIDRSAGRFTYQLSQKEGNILDHYISRINSDGVTQSSMFN